MKLQIRSKSKLFSRPNQLKSLLMLATVALAYPGTPTAHLRGGSKLKTAGGGAGIAKSKWVGWASLRAGFGDSLTGDLIEMGDGWGMLLFLRCGDGAKAFGDGVAPEEEILLELEGKSGIKEESKASRNLPVPFFKVDCLLPEAKPQEMSEFFPSFAGRPWLTGSSSFAPAERSRAEAGHITPSSSPPRLASLLFASNWFGCCGTVFT